MQALLQAQLQDQLQALLQALLQDQLLALLQAQLQALLQDLLRAQLQDLLYDLLQYLLQALLQYPLQAKGNYRPLAPHLLHFPCAGRPAQLLARVSDDSDGLLTTRTGFQACRCAWPDPQRPGRVALPLVPPDRPTSPNLRPKYWQQRALMGCMGFYQGEKIKTDV